LHCCKDSSAIQRFKAFSTLVGKKLNEAPPCIKYMKILVLTLSLLGLCSLVSCDNTSVDTQAAIGVPSSNNVETLERPEGWDEYWYSGKAEVNTYKVTQERYSEERASDAVLVFVTEPFLPTVQVKYDGAAAEEKEISVFKLNRLEKFNTGIYDYALMLSVFTPVSRDQHPHTLKTTFSAQDWCGQVWTQLNFRKGKYEVQGRSYFQREADVNESLTTNFLEDELVSLVRLNPAYLPSGKTKLVPPSKFSSLRHIPMKAENAEVSFGNGATENELVLNINYTSLDRQVTYRFDAAFPNKLLGWTEMYKGKTLSSASLKASVKETYWSQNSHSYDAKRAELGL